MQPPNTEPRSWITEAQVTALIRDDPAPEIDSGLELIDMNLEILEVLTADLAGGSVTRDSYATIHGTANFELTRALDWGRAIVRPFAKIGDAAFYLGAYFTEVPSWQEGTDPIIYSVRGHDILSALHDRVGTAYAVAAGANILTEVQAILTRQGFKKYIIDSTRSDATMPSNRVWALDDQTTWLTIVNDLLASIGYQGIHSDWRGALRSGPYIPPSDRSPEWVYYGTGSSAQLPIARNVTRDLYDAPNRWIAVRQNNIEGSAPVEGNGVYTYVNELQGPTSVEARGGRVITAPLITVDAADQSALVAAVQARAAADMANPTRYELSLPSPGNPLHWHFDRVYAVDPAMGLVDVLVTKWTYPLAPSTEDMEQTWMVLDA